MIHRTSSEAVFTDAHLELCKPSSLLDSFVVRRPLESSGVESHVTGREVNDITFVWGTQELSITEFQKGTALSVLSTY